MGPARLRRLDGMARPGRSLVRMQWIRGSRGSPKRTQALVVVESVARVEQERLEDADGSNNTVTLG